ncbi:MAG: hypothetical protein IPK07_34170 [Deltaproteobacteria bacterium]|jgi:hypothetical protein|nr:hypothetical protein [Deltaproteobacteria bacterium]
MAPLGDEHTTRVIRPAQLALLSTPALEIAETIVRASRSCYAQTWRRDTEHRVWRATTHDGSDRAALGFGADECANLRRLAHAAGGWVAWTTNPVFVPLASWLALHRTWAELNPE